MFEAVRARELPVALVEYEGEQHGFRKKENLIRTAGQRLLLFQVLARPPGTHRAPVEIENLDDQLHLQAG
jgi:hypothetical protein